MALNWSRHLDLHINENRSILRRDEDERISCQQGQHRGIQKQHGRQKNGRASDEKVLERQCAEP